MDLKKLALVPAIVALGFYATGATWAGEDKNGGDTPTVENGDADHDKNSGDNGDNAHSKNDNDNDNDNDKDGHGKNGDNDDHDKPDPKPDPEPDPKPDPKPIIKPNGGGGGGGNAHNDYGNGRRYRCNIGGYVYYVYRRNECGVRRVNIGGGYAHGGGYDQGGGDYVIVKRNQGKRARIRVLQQVVVGGDDDGDAYVQPRRIRYYSPASPAAMMQAQKRARKAARFAAYDAGGYGYGDGYAYGGGNGYSGGGYYGEAQIVVRKGRKHKKHRRVMVQQPAMNYGYDDGYGPIVSKGGEY